VSEAEALVGGLLQLPGSCRQLLVQRRRLAPQLPPQSCGLGMGGLRRTMSWHLAVGSWWWLTTARDGVNWQARHRHAAVLTLLARIYAYWSDDETRNLGNPTRLSATAMCVAAVTVAIAYVLNEMSRETWCNSNTTHMCDGSAYRVPLKAIIHDQILPSLLRQYLQPTHLPTIECGTCSALGWQFHHPPARTTWTKRYQA
jgi:hypothetical protein